MELIGEHLGEDLSTLGSYETYFGEGDKGEVRFYLSEPLTDSQIEEIESELCRQEVVLTGPIVQDAKIVYIKFQKAIAPLIIIAAIVGAIGTGLVGWQIFSTAKLGVPVWAWVIGGGALLYLLLRTKPAKAAGGLAIQAGKVYVGKKLVK